MKKLMKVLPVLMMVSMFAVAVNAQDKAAVPVAAESKTAAPAKAVVAPTAVPAVTTPAAAPVSATVAPAAVTAAPAPVAAVESKETVATTAGPDAQPVAVTRTNVAAADDSGKVYVFKEIKVDTVKTFEPAEVEKMKQEAAAEIKQIEGYAAQYNKPEATEKDKKNALKGIQEILGKRVDSYFVKFQERIDILDGVSKAAKEELKAEKKEKKDFVTSEAQAIVDGKVPAFRVPEVGQKAK